MNDGGFSEKNYVQQLKNKSNLTWKNPGKIKYDMTSEIDVPISEYTEKFEETNFSNGVVSFEHRFGKTQNSSVGQVKPGTWYTTKVTMVLPGNLVRT